MSPERLRYKLDFYDAFLKHIAERRANGENVGWRIDYFFVNAEFAPNVESAYILKDVMGSDHYLIGIGVEL